MTSSTTPLLSPERANGLELPEQVEQNLELHNRRVEAWRGVEFCSSRPLPGAIELGSNDYLQLAHHPEVIRAKVECLQTNGSDMLKASLFIDDDSLHHEFQEAMARHLRCESTILCQSGYAANVGLLQALAGPETPVYIDRIAHMSLWDGVHQARATALPFRHNDVDHLASRIRRHGRGVVVVDSVYSSDGSLCPLEELVSVARQLGCTLVVDETHSLGTHGARGEGMVCDLGLEADVAFRTASLSKAFSDRGGLVACPQRFVGYFYERAHPVIFSSAVMSYQVAGYLETLQRVRKEEWRRERLHRNAEALRSGLGALGYNVDASRSQIMALESGSEYRTLFLRDLLAARGVVGGPLLHPATERNRAAVRFSAHCNLSSTDIERALAVCAEVREAVELESWSSTRRKRGRSRGGFVFTRAEERRGGVGASGVA